MYKLSFFSTYVALLSVILPSAVSSLTFRNQTSSIASSRSLAGAGAAATPAPVLSSNAPTQIASVYTAADGCWKEWDAWSHQQTACPKTTSTGSTTTFEYTTSTTEYKTFKLCDGHPRAVPHGTYRTSHLVMSQYVLSSQTVPATTETIEIPPSGLPIATVLTTVDQPYTELVTACAQTTPAPRCTIDSPMCQSLFKAWTAGGFTRSRPPCHYTMPSNPCDDCNIFVPSVKLLYFPVTMAGNFCGNNYHTVTPTHKGNLSTPTTVVSAGYTFTSGSAYLSYAGVTAMGQGAICGTTKGPGILPLPSSSIFSYRGHAAALPVAGDRQWPFNFADLAPNPVPWDAWISQDLCYNHQFEASCQTITQAAYRPWIVYPQEFFGMESRWSKCVSGAFGIVDPPTALPVADGVVAPTMSKTAEASSRMTDSGMNGGHSVGSTTSSVSARTKGRPDPGTVQPSRTAEPESSAVGATSTLSLQPQHPGHHSAVGTETSRTPVDPSPGPSSAADPAEPSRAHRTSHRPLPTRTSIRHGDPGQSAKSQPHSSHPVFSSHPAEPTPHHPPPHPDPPQPTTAVTTRIPLTALRSSTLSLGTLPIIAPTDTKSHALQIGTHTLTRGEATHMGHTFTSLGSSSLVVSLAPSSPTPTDPATVGDLVMVTYEHGASRTTYRGRIDAARQTMIRDARAKWWWTYSGQDIVREGVTWSACSTTTSDGHGAKTTGSMVVGLSSAEVLPSVVVSNGTLATALPLPSIVSPSRPGAAPTATETKSSEAVALAAANLPLWQYGLAMLGVLLLLPP